MRELFLLRRQKNAILEAIQQAGLNPLDFEWREPISEYNAELIVSELHMKHLPGGPYYFFQFDYKSGKPFSRFSPGEDHMEESRVADSWSTRLSHVKTWLSSLKQEVESPDLWARLEEYTPDETFIGSAEISNAPFSHSDAENVIKSLDEMRAQIEENFKLQGDQLAFVSRQIDYLKDAAKRQGRKDWIHTSIGVIVTIATGLALSPEKAKLLWDLVRSCFASVLPLPAP